MRRDGENKTAVIYKMCISESTLQHVFRVLDNLQLSSIRLLPLYY